MPTDKGANAGGKVNAVVAGMVAGADSIDDLALLRHGAMGTVFDRPYALSTWGSFLRALTFGHVRQLDAVASRFLTGLADRAPLLAAGQDTVLLDVEDSIVDVRGYAKQGAAFGYSRVRGLNMLKVVRDYAALPKLIRSFTRTSPRLVRWLTRGRHRHVSPSRSRPRRRSWWTGRTRGAGSYRGPLRTPAAHVSATRLQRVVLGGADGQA